MAKKQQKRARGINRGTSFAVWWETRGRAMRDRIQAGKESQSLKERRLMEAGYTGGWTGRRDRDAKRRAQAKP